ncbi:hypothetical protein DLM45_03515 [Hyphomicrobium methylovorum]|uniref:hypothetical protein n=1 Tax=Hyphomicrobium methylovorum TaxID=84 RepID=UPI0015E7496A|nr:hypothetical protein [Hyphomicrobium methylovorum]
MAHDPNTLITGCLTRLDRIEASVARLQKAHAMRLSNPRGERAFNEIRLAKAAIEAECQVIKLKLTELRSQSTGDEQREKLKRRQDIAARLSAS